MANCSTIKDFERCKVDVLTAQLKDRGLHYSSYKKKQELVALAFAAYCQNLPAVGSRDVNSAASVQWVT